MARTLHFRFKDLTHPLQPLSTHILTQMLAGSCAAAFGSYNYPGVPTATQHVLLFYQPRGNDADPMVYFVDPYTVRRYNYLVSEINESLGSVDYFIYS